MCAGKDVAENREECQGRRSGDVHEISRPSLELYLCCEQSLGSIIAVGACSVLGIAC